MALEIVEKDSGGITVLELSGQVVLGGESSQLRQKVKDVLDKGKTQLVLDMARVRHVDSAGLGTLVAAYTTAQAQGAKLKLASLTDRFTSLLQITKLVTVFETYPRVDEAVRSFK